MAERTAQEVIDNGARPSMVAGTEEEAYWHMIDVRGPYKVETFYMQQAAANDFAADDTFNATIAHPMVAEITPITDLDNTAFPGSCDLTSDESNANFKQITLRDCQSINGLGIMVKVYGF
jgi:hypothetical protein